MDREERTARPEHRWPVVIAVLIALALYTFLPSGLFEVQRYVVVAIGVLLLIPLIILNPHRYTKETRLSRLCEVGLALLIVAANQVTGERLWQQFAVLSEHPRVSHARRQGMIFAWDVASSLPDFARRYARHALDQGLLLRPIGHTLYAMPPYVISEDEGQQLAQGAWRALEATLAEESAGQPAQAGVVDGV